MITAILQVTFKAQIDPENLSPDILEEFFETLKDSLGIGDDDDDGDEGDDDDDDD
jgi:hypothetical protein